MSLILDKDGDTPPLLLCGVEICCTVVQMSGVPLATDGRMGKGGECVSAFSLEAAAVAGATAEMRLSDRYRPRRRWLLLRRWGVAGCVFTDHTRRS